MEPSGLELFTTTELIDELMRRQTFLGVVVHSTEEYRNEEWDGARMFRVHFNDNLAPGEAIRLLETVAMRMEAGAGDR
jgi:hypothetical protein